MFEHLHRKLPSRSELLKGVFDVLVYGSAVRGKAKPQDIDVAVVLAEKTGAGKKLALAQQFRKILDADVKVFDVSDFLNPGSLARQGILAEGYSLLRKDYIAERFGFSAQTFVSYSLKGRTPSQQKMLYYALQGRKRGTGLLAKVGGSILSKGLLVVPTKHFEEIKELLQHHNVRFEARFAACY